MAICRFVFEICSPQSLNTGQQPQGHVQILLNILRGFTPQAALDAPRFSISAGSLNNSTGPAGYVNSEVYFEDRFSEETIAKLRGRRYVQALYILLTNVGIDMGHDARLVSGFDRGIVTGNGQAIQKLQDASGRFVWAAGSDPRADGYAGAQI